MTREIHGKCQKMMSGLDINIVRDVSVGAAAFYVWVSLLMSFLTVLKDGPGMLYII